MECARHTFSLQIEGSPLCWTSNISQDVLLSFGDDDGAGAQSRLMGKDADLSFGD
jgi:hypothetical protein